MLILASPFDYLNQALVCLPSGLPDPQSVDFDEAVVRVVADIAGRIGGRTLARFTSHPQLPATHLSPQAAPRPRRHPDPRPGARRAAPSGPQVVPGERQRPPPRNLQLLGGH